MRINLLPREVEARNRAARQRNALIVAFVVLLLLLAVVYWLKVNEVGDAESERDAAQAELAVLQAEQNELAEYADLEQRVDQADQTLSTALAGEVSFAGVLQDVAAVMPTDAALETFDLTLIQQVAPDGDELRPVIGRITAAGETLTGHAPGLERLLLEYDKLGGFFDVFVTNSTIDPEDEDVAIFSFEVDLGADLYTNRYLDGVPEGLR